MVDNTPTCFDQSERIALLEKQNTLLRSQMDTTVQKLHDAAIREGEYLNMFESVTDGILKLNEQNRIVDCNQSIVVMLGYESKLDLIGKSPLEFVGETFVIQVQNAFDFFESNQNSIEELILLTSEGREFPTMFRVFYFSYNDRESYSIAIFQDLTLLRQFENAQKEQYERFTCQSLIRQKIAKVSSLDPLLKVLCEEMLHLTKSCCTWVVRYNEGEFGTSYFIKRKTKELQAIKGAEIINGDSIFTNDTYKRIHTKGYPNVVSFSFLSHAERIIRQQILVIRISSGEIIAIGLNYFLENEEVTKDRELLEFLSSFLEPMVESIYAKDQLRKNEAMFRALTEEVSDIIVVADADGIIKYASPSVASHGYEVDDVVGTDLYNYVLADDQGKLTDGLTTLMNGPEKNILVQNVKVFTKDRSLVHSDISITNLLDQPEINGLVLNARNITESILFEKKLAESELKYKTLFNSATAGIVLVQDGRFILCNDKFYDLFGDENKDTIIGKSTLDFLSPKQKEINGRPEEVKAIRERIKSGECFAVEWEFVKLDGTPFFAQMSANHVHINGQDYTMSLLFDITEAKIAERMMRLSEKKFRSIFNHSSDAIFITTYDGDFLEVNKTAIDRSGFSKEQFAQMNLVGLKHQSDSNNVKAYLQKIVDTGEATAEFTYASDTTDVIYTETIGRLIEYNDQKAIVHFSRDISAQKELNREVLNAIIRTEEKERLRYAQDLHDGIGPYLSATKFFLSSIVREDDPQLRERITEKAEQSIDEIIKSIKDISNNISPHVLQNFGVVSALQSFIKKMPDQSVEISVDTNCEGVRFNSDLEMSVFRILTELINNSYKYAKASKLEVRINFTSKKLSIEYEDDGVGMNIDDKISSKGGNGLFNIINRVTSLKGVYKFTSEKGEGFRFHAIFMVK